jgi:hypothetical protein
MYREHIFAPSFIAHIISGILLLVAFIILYKNYSIIKNLDKYRLITIVLVFSIAIGVHSLSHLGMETIYGYYPITIIAH